jgi:hypothetical protein
MTFLRVMFPHRLYHNLFTFTGQHVLRTSASPRFFQWDYLKSRVHATRTRELEGNCSNKCFIAASDAELKTEIGALYRMSWWSYGTTSRPTYYCRKVRYDYETAITVLVIPSHVPLCVLSALSQQSAEDGHILAPQPLHQALV